MRTSNKMLTVFTAIPFLIVLLLTLFVNVIPADSLNKGFFEDEFYSGVTRRFPCESFNIIDFANVFDKSWVIEIVRGDEYSVEINAPSHIIDDIRVISNRWWDNLSIRFEFGSGSHRGESSISSIFYKNTVTLSSDKTNKVYARITTPSISGIKMVMGTATIKISGFTIDSLNMEIKGLGNVTGENCSINNLSYIGEGIAKIDLSKVPVKNADIQFIGHHTIDLLMNGGKLTGTTNKRLHPGQTGNAYYNPENRGRIRYKGEISANEIESCPSCEVYKQ